MFPLCTKAKPQTPRRPRRKHCSKSRARDRRASHTAGLCLSYGGPREVGCFLWARYACQAPIVTLNTVQAAAQTLQNAARARQARSSCRFLRRAEAFTLLPSMGAVALQGVAVHGESLHNRSACGGAAVVRAAVARRSLGRAGEGAAGAAAVVVQRGVRRLAARRAVDPCPLNPAS